MKEDVTCSSLLYWSVKSGVIESYYRKYKEKTQSSMSEIDWVICDIYKNYIEIKLVYIRLYQNYHNKCHIIIYFKLKDSWVKVVDLNFSLWAENDNHLINRKKHFTHCTVHNAWAICWYIYVSLCFIAVDENDIVMIIDTVLLPSPR